MGCHRTAPDMAWQVASTQETSSSDFGSGDDRLERCAFVYHWFGLCRAAGHQILSIN